MFKAKTSFSRQARQHRRFGLNIPKPVFEARLKMKYRQLHRTSFAVLVFCAASVQAETLNEVQVSIVSELQRDGYLSITVRKTLLGRTKIEAINRLGEREIVISPNGQVVRNRYDRFSDLSDEEALSLLEDVERRLNRSLTPEEIEDLLEDFDEADLAGLSGPEIDDLLDDLEDGAEQDSGSDTDQDDDDNDEGEGDNDDDGDDGDDEVDDDHDGGNEDDNDRDDRDDDDRGDRGDDGDDDGGGGNGGGDKDGDDDDDDD